MSGLLEGKTILITGIITDSSIAFHAASVAQEQGAKVVITGIPERCVSSIASPVVSRRSAARDRSRHHERGETRRTRDKVRELAPEGVDGVLHSIAMAPRT